MELEQGLKPQVGSGGELFSWIQHFERVREVVRKDEARWDLVLSQL